tara:strand:- start:8008 stop:9126 length:1119 start_codon:yes stop_codon:yes gene_type:complete
MSKGGGGAPSQVSNITVPEYAKPYMERLLGRSEALVAQPTPQFQGQVFADPTVRQREIRERAANLRLPRGLQTGAQMTEAAGQRALTASQYNPYQFQMERIQAPFLADRRMQAAQVDPFASSRYMNPYMQQVVDVQKRKAIEDAEQSQLLQNLQAARRGTLGGGRQAVLQAQREKALGQQLGDIQATGQQRAFEQAQQVAFKNLDARQQANVQNLASQLETQGLGAKQAFDAALKNQMIGLDTQRAAEQSRQFAATLGLRGADALRAAGVSSADIARKEAATEFEQLKLQEAIARQQQIEDQRRLDYLQKQFERRTEDPFTRLGFMSDILRGTSALRGGTAIYDAPQTALQQIVGTGLPAYGLYRSLTGPQA